MTHLRTAVPGMRPKTWISGKVMWPSWMSMDKPTPKARPQSMPTNKHPRNTTIHTNQSGLLACNVLNTLSPVVQPTHQTQSIHTNQSGSLACTGLGTVSLNVQLTHQMHCIESGTIRHQHHCSDITGQIAQGLRKNALIFAHGSHALQFRTDPRECASKHHPFSQTVCVGPKPSE